MNDLTDVYRLSFSVGPVQTFVAQARRTRDLWAGSWLLSYLVEQALVAAEQADGQAIIPYRDADDRKKPTSVRSPIGGVPNRFEVAFKTSDEAAAAGQAATNEFHSSWQSLAEFTWQRYLANICDRGNGVREIWDRQVANFFELNWVVSPTPAPDQPAGGALAARKIMRNSPATIEPGTKCSMISSLQELSGYAGRGHWKSQADFWEAFQSQSTVKFLDLGSNERLCAIALIKRFLPEMLVDYLRARKVPEASGVNLDEQCRWPSLGFLAAMPWLRKVASDPEASSHAQELSQEATSRSRGEEDRFWDSERVPARDFGLPAWGAVDATAWHSSGLASSDRIQSKATREDLQQRQRRLYQTMSGQTPLPYYALLLADGDSLGTLLSRLKNPNLLSERLDAFCHKVSEIISPAEGNGRVVYAGGDDVLALLTADTAVETAYALNLAYREAFRQSDAHEIATLSATIVLSPWKHPLHEVIRTAHELLDGFAKDGTGRDSIAIGQIQGGGVSALWSVPWGVIEGKHTSVSYRSLLSQFSSTASDDTLSFNSSFLYRMRNYYSGVIPSTREVPGYYRAVPGELNEVLLQLAHSEYRRRLSSEERMRRPANVTKPPIQDLMALAYRWKTVKNQHDQPEAIEDTKSFSFDGWKIARFLKQVEEGRLAQHE